VVFEHSPFYLAVMAVLPLRKRTDAVIRERITAVLAEVGPLLRIDHCLIEIVEFSVATGRLTLQIDGSCPDCELSPATFMPAIEAHVKQRVPEVLEVSVIAQ
jgi:Fe-S cluster biogenesis protein NfuA